MGAILDSFVNLWNDTGLANFNYQNGIMIIVSFIFLYLAIRRGFEPLLRYRLHSVCCFRTCR